MNSCVKGCVMLEEMIRVVTSRSTSYDDLMKSCLGIFVLSWIVFPFTECGIEIRTEPIQWMKRGLHLRHACTVT